MIVTDCSALQIPIMLLHPFLTISDGSLPYYCLCEGLQRPKIRENKLCGWRQNWFTEVFEALSSDTVNIKTSVNTLDVGWYQKEVSLQYILLKNTI